MDWHAPTCQSESEIRCVCLATADHSRSRSPISCAALSFPGPVLPIRAGTMRGRSLVIEIAGDRVRLGRKQSAAPCGRHRPSQGLGTAPANHDTVAESGSAHSPPADSLIGRPRPRQAPDNAGRSGSTPGEPWTPCRRIALTTCPAGGHCLAAARPDQDTRYRSSYSGTWAPH